MPKEFEKAERVKHTIYVLIGKRILDVAIVLPALIVLIPVFLFVAIIIKIDSKGPIIYRQKRVGKGTREFEIFKFRTMVINADKIGPKSTRPGDDRITRAGNILRKSSLDELPQLFNVLMGDMSIVGYRPGLKENYDSIFLSSNIFMLKPGITGYAQVNGRSKLTTEEKRKWEMKYFEDASLTTDLRIILKTAQRVILRDGTN